MTTYSSNVEMYFISLQAFNASDQHHFEIDSRNCQQQNRWPHLSISSYMIVRNIVHMRNMSGLFVPVRVEIAIVLKFSILGLCIKLNKLQQKPL